MSAVPSISIFCDHKGHTLCPEHIVLEVEDIDDARRAAERCGWASEGGRAFCPMHATSSTPGPVAVLSLNDRLFSVVAAFSMLGTAICIVYGLVLVAAGPPR